jgi:hypothetical protein
MDRGSGRWLLDGVSTARGVGMIPGCRGRAGIASTGGVWRWFVRGVGGVVEDLDAEFVRGVGGVVEDLGAEFVRGVDGVVEDLDAEFVRGVGGVVEGVGGPPCMSHERSRAERSR